MRPHLSPSLFASFTRSQVSAFTASVVDFSVMVMAVEWLGVWYVVATAVGALSGAITNFCLGRYWTFKRGVDPLERQLVRYLLVSGSSLILNSVLIWLVTETLRSDYRISKILVSFAIGIGFNFPMHRYFVFR